MKKVIPLHSKPETATQKSGSSMKAPKIVKTTLHRAALANLPKSWNDGVEQQTLLMQRILGLNTVSPIVSAFYSWCDDLGLADGISYEQGSGKPVINLGVRRHHSAHYKVNLDDEDLGLVTLCRRERFNESELLCIEQALGNLARSLRGALEFEALQEMATKDPLTGLGNRRSLHQWMERELSRTRRHESPLSVLVIDLDHFKKLNEELGHLGGDRVLQAIAGVFKRSTRASDLLFRFGGDEFTVLLPHTDLQGACRAARHIRKNLTKLSNEELGLSDSHSGPRPDLSIGVADYQPGDTEETLFQRADTRLYHAKAQGRGAVCSNV